MISTALLCLLIFPSCIEKGENSLGQPKQLTESLKAVKLEQLQRHARRLQSLSQVQLQLLGSTDVIKTLTNNQRAICETRALF